MRHTKLIGILHRRAVSSMPKENGVFWDIKPQFLLREDILRLRYKA
jgi:hypothetical protein